jgi:hypothetical protein
LNHWAIFTHAILFSGTSVQLEGIAAVHYTIAAIYIIVALASLFGVIGCIAVSA